MLEVAVPARGGSPDGQQHQRRDPRQTQRGARGRPRHGLSDLRHGKRPQRLSPRPGEISKRELDAGSGHRKGPPRGPRAVARRLRFPAGDVPGPRGGVRAAGRFGLHAAGHRLSRRAGVPHAGHRPSVLARRVVLPAGQAGDVQRPRLRPAADGAGRLRPRLFRPRILPGQSQPLQRQSHRPVRLAVQLRRLPPGGRPQPDGQARPPPGRRRQDGNGWRSGLRDAPGRTTSGDQRLLHVRYIGHLFRLSSHCASSWGR